MDLDAIPSAIGAPGGWEKRPDAWWLEAPRADPPALARVLLEAGARLVTMTASAGPDGEFRVIYHWDREGRLLNVALTTRGAALPSVAADTPAADWIEREIHDYFAVRFAGRDLPPLFLAPGDAPGALGRNLRPDAAAKGKDGKVEG